jgi:hypothetical protein
MQRIGEMVRLGDLANIGAGSSIRGKMPIDPDGDTYVIQQRDISVQGIATGSVESILYPKGVRDPLLDGDVLLRSKGSPTVAAEFKERGGTTFALPVIAAPSVLILRLRQDAIMPGYLVWLLNSRWGQKILADRRTGKTIPVISRMALEDIAVPVPPIDEQRRICELSGLARRHEQLASQYREKIDTLLETKSLGSIRPDH